MNRLSLGAGILAGFVFLALCGLRAEDGGSPVPEAEPGAEAGAPAAGETPVPAVPEAPPADPVPPAVPPEPAGEPPAAPPVAPPGEKPAEPPEGPPAGPAGEMWKEPPSGMVEVPAGEFIMGATDITPNEKPEHRVHIPRFFIQRTEVTNGEYKRFLDDLRTKKAPLHWDRGMYPPGTKFQPVFNVTYKDCQEYAEWAGNDYATSKLGRPLTAAEKKRYAWRLPNEEEWEKAARGTEGWDWPWGNAQETPIPEFANTMEKWAGKKGGVVDVAKFEKGKSAYGCYDMAGNVWEWTSTWFQAYPDSSTLNGDFGEKFKVIRGGSYIWDAERAKCAHRGYEDPKDEKDVPDRPGFRAIDVGFRCAWAPPGE